MTEEAANETEEASDESVLIDIFQRDLKALSEEERQACEEFLMAESVAWRAVKKTFGRQGMAATGHLQRIVDKIWTDAYRKAKECFDPECGTFEALLYKICRNKALNERRRYLVSIPKPYSKVIVTVGVEGNGVRNSYTHDVLQGERGLRYCKYVFDFSGSGQFFFPLGFKDPFHAEALFGGFENLDAKDQPVSSVSESVHWADHNELFARVAAIGDDELHQINPRRLPKLFKKLNKEALRRELARIDVEIVRMYTLVGNPDKKKVTQKQVQETVHIKRNFYDYRIEAITERLQLGRKLEADHPVPSQDSAADSKKRCVHEICHLAARLNPPVLKKVFTFNVKPNAVKTQSIHVDDQRYVFVWQDTPRNPMRKGERHVPESEHWYLVGIYVDDFADDR